MVPFASQAVGLWGPPQRRVMFGIERRPASPVNVVPGNPPGGVDLMPRLPHPDQRQRPRTRVAWPVVVKVGTSRYLARSMDISTHGAKVRTKARLKTGVMVQLELVPPEGPPIRVEALVWRIDADGLAFLFCDTIQHQLIRLTSG